MIAIAAVWKTERKQKYIAQKEQRSGINQIFLLPEKCASFIQACVCKREPNVLAPV